MNAWLLGWNLKPLAPASTWRLAIRTASAPRAGSTEPNGMRMSAWSRARSMISMGVARAGSSGASRWSIVNVTAAIFRSR